MRQRHAVLTDAQRERAAVLRAEGMPMPWIAEDLGVLPGSLRSLTLPGSAEAHHSWLQQWARIRRQPELRALHDEFTPPEQFHRR
jgi:hypothetical protein